MENRDFAFVHIQSKIDKLIENILTSKSETRQFKPEYVKFVNICRSVGVYDTDLAWEAFYSAMMLSYTFSMMVFEELE